MTRSDDPRSELFVEERPWGSYERFIVEEPATVKIITVLPGQRLSLQTHRDRAEYWRVLDGEMDVTVGADTWRAQSGELVWIPVGERHRLANPGETPGRVLELAFGPFDEADITRVEDDYTR